MTHASTLPERLVEHTEPAVNSAGGEQVAIIQRARILAAMAEVCSEHGVAETSVAHVVARAGVSRRTFYEQFADREECFLAAFDDGIAHATRSIMGSYDPSAGWVEQVRTALTALLCFLEGERGLGRLLVVDSLGAGTPALERRARVLAKLTAFIDTDEDHARTRSSPGPLTAEGIVGAVLAVIHARMINSENPPLVELRGPLMVMIVLPYLGKTAARRELQRPLPQTRAPQRSIPADPLSGLEMRLTYRTVRVLSTIGSHPSASNKQIGEASGATDQGQISKLLARLQRLGLIDNHGTGHTKGGPNAWTLTQRGKQVHNALTTQTNHT